MHSNEIMKLHILLLTNLTWESGLFLRNYLNSVIVPIYKGGGKSVKDPINYRLVALIFYLCELTKRLVINRLIYTIESQNIFQDNQSEYRIARGILDPLTRLVAKINKGFNSF